MTQRLSWLGFISFGLVALGCSSLFVALTNSPASAALSKVFVAMATATSSPTPHTTATATYTPRPTRTPTSTETAPRFAATRTETLLPGKPTAPPTHTPTPSPTRTPLPDGRSELQIRELVSAAIVGNLNPSQNLPSDIADCHWVQQDAPRIACKVQVFLPPGYFNDQRRYAVVYLLHGWGGWDTKKSDSEWNLYGTYAIADDMMRAGEIPPFIIVVPEGGHTYWLNHADDHERWGDYVAAELVNFIDANYRTIPRRESRAIGGLSMGGLGAIQLALNHPDEFAVVGMRSPSLRRIGDPDVPPFFGDASYYANYDPLILVDKSDAVKQLSIYVIIGDKDMWLARTQEFRQLLDQKNASYEWHIYAGGHDGIFFGSHIDEELHFYGANLSIQ